MVDKKAFIFDFDGTLADTLPVFLNILHIHKNIFRIKKNIEIDDNFVSKLKTLGMRAILKELELSTVVLPFILRYVRYKFGKHIHEVKPFEHVSEVLQNLKDSGYIVGVLTSNSKRNVKKFFALNDLPAIDFIYSENALFGKEKTIKKIIKRHRLDSSKVFYIGDESRDIEAAQKAGVSSVAVTWGYNSEDLLKEYKPIHIISSIKELQNL